jgi:hypothetical protein
MAWTDIVNFVFKEVPTFTKMNAILENIKVHNHKGTNQGVRIDNQLSPATVPAPSSGTVSLTGGVDLIQSLAVPVSGGRNCTLHVWCTQTGANIVTWSFTGTVGALVPSGFKGIQPTTTSQSYYIAIPIGPVAVAGNLEIRASSAAGISVAVRAWVSN